MASHFNAFGTLIYQAENGQRVTFPGDVVTKISSRNVPTSDGRGVKWVEHTLTVDGWLYNTDVAGAATVDDAFALARKILAQSGGRLTIADKGFGDYAINRDTSIGRDLNFGPHTDVVEWQPFGNVTCKFSWVVKFCLPWKDGASTGNGAILDYSWTTEYEYDAEGYCTRNISVHLEISGARPFPGSAVLFVTDHIEQYTNNIICTCPVGWRRRQHSMRISADKRSVDLTYVDDPDKGFAFYPGIADMDAMHEMSSQSGEMTLSTWIWTISVSAIPMAGYQSFHAYQACLAVHQARFASIIKNLVNSNGSIMPLPLQFKITERLKTRQTTLVASWMLVSGGSSGGYSPIDILTRSGMWQPLPWSSDDASKIANLVGGPNRTGGWNRMVSDPSQNIIIDVSSVIPGVPDPGRVQQAVTLTPKGPNDDLIVLSPYGQYLEFKVYVSCYTIGGKWVNYPLVNNEVQGNGRFDEQFVQNLGGYNKFVLYGVIMRVGLPPAALPEIKYIGSAEVVVSSADEQWTKTEPVLNAQGYLVWKTTFSIPFTCKIKDTSKPNKALNPNKKPDHIIRDSSGRAVVVIPGTINPQ